jgi:hypothetical protein
MKTVWRSEKRFCRLRELRTVGGLVDSRSGGPGSPVTAREHVFLGAKRVRPVVARNDHVVMVPGRTGAGVIGLRVVSCELVCQAIDTRHRIARLGAG